MYKVLLGFAFIKNCLDPQIIVGKMKFISGL